MLRWSERTCAKREPRPALVARTTITGCAIATLLLITDGVGAREWTTTQAEVLAVVEAYTEASHRRDLDAYLSYWHTEFLGWHNGDPAPTNKEQRRRGLQRYFAATKSLGYELEPLGVQVLAGGDAAIVHYVLRNVLESHNGERVRGVSHWTDYLVRENGRWLLLSDHGGAQPAVDSGSD